MALSFKTFRGIARPFKYQHTSNGTTPKPLTGCTIYFTVKADLFDDSLNDSTALIKKTITNHVDENGVASDAAGYSYWWLTDAEMYYSAADNTPIEPGDYYWGVIVENPDGKCDPPSLYGTVTIEGHPSNRQVVNG